jgi:metallo-beta-lactamase class B
MTMKSYAVAVLTTVAGITSSAWAQQDTAASHFAAAKAAAGTDHVALFEATCERKPGPPPAPAAPRVVPERSTWHHEPVKVFDNLYYIGEKEYSAWAVVTSDGIIVLDTIWSHSVEDEIVGGLKKLGFDPATVKYVIITHAHDGEVGGAKLMQDRFGSRIVMGGGDWDMIDAAVNLFPNGKPRRDIVAADGQKITLGGRSVTLVLTPGHTPGTVSLIFDVKDNGRPLTVAFSGGTEFNFVNDVPHFDTYIASARKMEAAAAAAKATILMSNQSEYDFAYQKIRMLASRRPGEPHPFEVGTDAVQRYFRVFDECAQVARLKLLGAGK